MLKLNILVYWNLGQFDTNCIIFGNVEIFHQKNFRNIFFLEGNKESDGIFWEYIIFKK
jgi:hypothetical protein